MPESKDTPAPIVAEAVVRVIQLGLANARMRGEQWQTLAEEFLESTELALRNIDRIHLELLRNQSAPAREMSEMNEKIIELLERLADAVWIQGGQSPEDPYISILSPGTPHFFFEWPIGRHVDRLEILLELFADKETQRAQSGEVRTVIAELQAMLPQFHVLNESVRAFRAKNQVLEKATEVVARVGHVRYSRLRRRMIAEGFDVGEVKKVFPDIQGTSTPGTLG